MWGSNYREMSEDYLKNNNIGRVFATIKDAVKIPVAKCESGKLKVGQKMPNKKPKSMTKSRPAEKLGPVPSYEMLGGTINMISNQMMMMTDGFDMSMTNVIADNGNMAMGVQGDSYFSLRHQMSFEGPLGFLMTGGQRDYAVEAIAQKGKDYTLVANWTPSQGTLDGQWEHHWSKHWSSMFQFAVTSSDSRQLAMYLPNFSGKVTYQDTMRNISVGKGQTEAMYCSTMHRVLPRLLVGSKLSYSPDSGVANMSAAAQYKIRGPKPQELETIECRASSKSVTAMYTRQISKHATLAAKCDVKLASKTATSSFLYKYLFGSENTGTQIMGEITSKMQCKVIYMMPFMQRFMLRVNGEMNHFDYNPKQGQVPHKFGFNIMMQL